MEPSIIEADDTCTAVTEMPLLRNQSLSGTVFIPTHCRRWYEHRGHGDACVPKPRITGLQWDGSLEARQSHVLVDEWMPQASRAVSGPTWRMPQRPVFENGIEDLTSDST